MNKSRASHPIGNGESKRMNRTLFGMLGTLSDEQNKDWKALISDMVYAYKCTRRKTTGQSPYYIMLVESPLF